MDLDLDSLIPVGNNSAVYYSSLPGQAAAYDSRVEEISLDMRNLISFTSRKIAKAQVFVVNIGVFSREN
jgi:hypothetical protein